MLEDFSMWRDVVRNKVFVKYGTETIEIPWVIDEAYRRQEENSFDLYKAISKRSEMLTDENLKLRKLIDLLIWGMKNDVTPAENLVWSQKVNVMMRELRIEENNA